MSEKTLKTRIRHAVKTESEWASLNPVLLSGEIGYVKDSDNSNYGRYKIGDGTKHWNELNYADKIIYDKIDEVKIGGRNLWFKTKDYDASAYSGWVDNNNGDRQQTTAPYTNVNGFGVQRIDFAWRDISQRVAIEPNTIYTLSAWIKWESSAATICFFTNTGSMSGTDVSSQVGTDDYKRVSVTFNSGDATTSTCRFECSSNTPYLIYGLKLELGNKATDWTPAPEDKADTVHTHSASDITSGTLSSSHLPTVPVSKGGTGLTTITSGQVLVGNGAGNVTTRAIDTTSGGTSGSTSLITSGAVYSGLDGKANSNHTHSYLPLSGGTMNGSIKFNSNSLPSKSLEFICGIDAFANGGEMGWQEKEEFLSGCSKTGHTHNYAGSTSAGGAANYLSVQQGNEINFTNATPVADLWFNYRNADNGSTSNDTAIATYRFGNKNGSTSGVTLFADSFAGNSASASRLATARTISLTGSVTGSGTFDGSGDLSINTTVSHTHNYAGSTSAGGAANSLSGFTNTTNSVTAVDSATQNGHVYVNGTSDIYGQSDGAAFIHAYSTSWVAQIYQDYRSGQIALRGKNNGTWQSWRKVLDSANYTSYCTPANIGAATSSHTHTKSQITDLQTSLDNKLDKTSYEYNKELSLGYSGKVCVGTFNCYDTNITVEIKSTTYVTYNGILIIATQNARDGGGSFTAVVYGDEDNSLTNLISIERLSGSGAFSIYINFPPWSKNILHIQCVALDGSPTNIATVVDSIPSTATIIPTNAFTHTHNYAGSSSAGGSATSAVKLDSSAGSATQPIYFSDGKPVSCAYSLGKSVPSDAVFTDTVYTHPTTAGNKHIPSGGSSGQILRWSADGTAVWGDDNNAELNNKTSVTIVRWS